MAGPPAPAGPPGATAPPGAAPPPPAGLPAPAGGGDPGQQLAQILSEALSIVMQAGPTAMPQMLPLLKGFFGEVDKLIAPARQGMNQAGPQAGASASPVPPGPGAPQRPM